MLRHRFNVPLKPPRRPHLAAFAVLVLVLAGCGGSGSLEQQADAGSNKNYIAGDGSVSEYAPALRGEPVSFTGKLYSGETVSAQQWRGDVAVLNFWYAACAPCRLEAPDLQALHEKYRDRGVKFYGVNVRDERATAEAFERNFGITYPSFDDGDGGILLAMTQYVPPQAVPTTLVLDRRGRVAARILGVSDESTLDALISAALKGR